jgi:hypothetical protein
MFEDNKEWESLATNDMTTEETKHINIHHHFIGDFVKSKVVTIVWLETSEMFADIPTKNSRSTSVHKKHTELMLSGTYLGQPTSSVYTWGSVGIHCMDSFPRGSDIL